MIEDRRLEASGWPWYVEMTDTYYRHTVAAHVLYYCYNITLYVVQSWVNGYSTLVIVPATLYLTYIIVICNSFHLKQILPFLETTASVYQELTSFSAGDVFVALLFFQDIMCSSLSNFCYFIL